MSAYDDPDYADERIEELCGETIEKLRAELAAAHRMIEAQNERVSDLWSDWRIERENVALAREQRDDARQLAVDFKAAQRTIEAQAFILEVLEAQGVSMPDKYYDLKEGKD